MPKTKRDLLKRQVAHAHNNMQLAVNHIAEVGIAFQDVHPELAEGLIIATQLLNQADEVIKAFVLAAWGHDDPAWDSWRNVSKRRTTQEIAEDEIDIDADPNQMYIELDLKPGMEVIEDETSPTGYRMARAGDDPNRIITISDVDA